MHRRIAVLIAAAGLAALAVARPLAAPAVQESWPELRAEAEALMEEGSHAAALERWQAAAALAEEDRLSLDDAQRRWLDLRVADCTWRSTIDRADRTVVDAALAELRALAPDATPLDERDRVWAEARESLGDEAWAVSRRWNLGPALEHYRAALEWWGRSSDLDLARERWLAIFWRMAQPDWAPGDFDTGYGRGAIPLELAESALALARDDDERGRAHLVVGRLTLPWASNPRYESQALEHLRAAIDLGRATSAHDDALYALGQHLETNGRLGRDDEGRWEHVPDLVGAVARYRELRAEYGEGESRWWRAAGNRIRDLTEPAVRLWVPGAFLPESQVGFALTSRNVERVDLTLYPLDLERDVRLTDPDRSPWSWVDTIDVDGRAAERSFAHEVGDAADHAERSANLTLDPAPATGAYLLVARAGGVTARELVLVTDASLVTFAAGRDCFLWATRATDGEPLPGVDLDLRARVRDRSGKRIWKRFEALADTDGLARVDLGALQSSQVFAVANTPSGPAVCLLSTAERPAPAQWGIHVTTDRPAYRPDQTVHFSVIARTLDDDGGWTPPSGREVRYELIGPRGETLESADLALDAFGTASGSFVTTPDQTLGVYRLRFLEGGEQIGDAELFRLEEYVRPEFEVRVELPETDTGRPEVFVLGDEVRAEVVATTYAGAPVAGAEVELVVKREQHWHVAPRTGEFAWFERSLNEGQHRGWWGGGEEILRTAAVTDAEGRATVAFDTWGLDSGEWKFTVEARVTDALRREVSGTGTVLVAEHAFRARVETEHRIFAPGVAIDATVVTEDPNGSPVSVTGSATLIRLRSYTAEEWRARFGEPTSNLYFPHTVEEELQRITLETAADGRAQWTPTPPGEGTYLVRFDAADPRSGGRVAGETRAIVCSDRSTDVGLRTGGIELIADADAIAEGEDAPIVILTDRSGRAVLLAVESRGALDVRVLRLRGTAKLVSVPLTEGHVPRTTLTVVAVDDGRLLRDAESLIVPPARHLLAVEATLDAERYEPGDPAVLDLLVRDHEGSPVTGHLSVSLFDESLTAIQGELAGDPRLTFFGTPSWYRAAQASSFDRRSYGRFVIDAEWGAWRDEREVAAANGLAPEGETRLLREERKRSAGMAGAVFDSDARLTTSMEALGYVESSAEADFAAAAPARGQQLGMLGQASGGGPDPVVRVDFRETALWDADVLTDEHGRATLELTWPDSTTRWKLDAVACDADSSFGLERASVARTTLPLLLRLATPRFLVAGDETVVATMVRNDTDAPIEARLSLATAGEAAQVVGPLTGGAVVADAAGVTVPAGGEVTVDWLVRARAAGEATFVAAVVSGERSDGIERSLPVLEHGLEVVIAAAGVADSSTAELVVDLPPARPGSTTFDIVVTPSLATTAIAALPYLADYPYGCLEQTLSRFVPAIVTLDALERLGLDREQVATATFDPPTHTRAPDDERTPTLEKVDAMVTAGLERVLSMQNGDGGFAWWPGGSTDPFMTGYAVWALSLAVEAGVDTPAAAVMTGARWLEHHMVEAETDLQLAAWELHAWAAAQRALASRGGPPLTETEAVVRAFQQTYEAREALGAYGRAALLLTAHQLGREEETGVLLRNLVDGVLVEGPPGGGLLQPGLAPVGRTTAHWGEQGFGHRWSQDGTEATAFALRAMLAVDPDHELVEPTIEWLVLNRRGARWKSTRDTAICVLALVDAVEMREELSASGEFWLSVDGVEVGGGTFDPAHAWIQPLRWPVRDLGEGRHVVSMEQKGTPRRMYWHVAARTFSVEERVAPRANELVVRRDVYRLAGRETLLAGKVFERVKLEHGDAVESGDRIEVVVTLRTRAPLEYVIVEDHKAAGFEAVELQSGGPAWATELRADEIARRFGEDPGGLDSTVGDALPGSIRGGTGRRQWAYRELRDTRVVSFLDRLPEGTWELRTTLRAEGPGTYAALPATASAMYAPDLAGNSWELELTVE